MLSLLGNYSTKNYHGWRVNPKMEENSLNRNQVFRFNVLQRYAWRVWLQSLNIYGHIKLEDVCSRGTENQFPWCYDGLLMYVKLFLLFRNEACWGPVKASNMDVVVQLGTTRKMQQANWSGRRPRKTRTESMTFLHIRSTYQWKGNNRLC